MEKKYSLNGEWDLYFKDEINGPDSMPDNSVQHIKAIVPGNAELDLSNAGLLPKDIYKGLGTVIAEKYESYGFWYYKTFTKPEVSQNEKLLLRFDAVDCIAEYYLNGKLIYKSDNAFIAHEIDITSVAQEINELCVHISPCLKTELESEYNTYLIYGRKYGGAPHIRKPLHSFGWDIFPRALAPGLWRDVNLVVKNDSNFENVYYKVNVDENKKPTLVFCISVNAPANKFFGNGLTVKINGTCGESLISGQALLKKAKSTQIFCSIKDPKLWWPYGYGDSNVYDTKVELFDGDVLIDTVSINVGLRSLKLERTELLTEADPKFHFYVNNEPIFCRGSNWVPLDAYHSKDKNRYKKALELATDIGCNMLRVWGGGVYEAKEFYDYCDRHGILIWQDFMMACQFTPQDNEFLKKLRKEFTFVIKELRNHPSIALWSGDNEVDEVFAATKIPTDFNKITRELLPNLILEHDPERPYLASSPYLSPQNFDKYWQGYDIFPERHLWGSRDYFKSDFYKNSKAIFVSETGYHGCPSKESIEKIVDSQCVWPCFNEQWTLHSSDQTGNDGRVRLMDNQIKQLFGINADNLDDFVFASQISQAEAKKYFIERMRVRRPYTSGILWWNLLDGWPQMSDAVVDYFYNKKIAYSFIKHSQMPVALMVDEMRDWHYTLVAANDTLYDVCGNYTITDIETSEILHSGNFNAKANTSTKISNINMFYSDQKMLLIKWEIDGKAYYNHYLCGMPAFSLEKYKCWYEKLKEFYNDNSGI